jgi:hypothetical protein
MISPICDVVPLVNSLCHRAVTRRVGRAWALGKTIALRIQASQEGRDSTRSCKLHSEGSIGSSKSARRAAQITVFLLPRISPVAEPKRI